MKNCCYKIFSTAAKPQELFARFKDGVMPFLLESGRGVSGKGRYSFFSCDPFIVLRCVQGRCVVVKGDLTSVVDGAPLQVFREFLSRYRLCGRPPQDIPLACGAVGFFSYDFGFRLEKIKRKNEPKAELADFVFGFYDWMACVDHLKGKLIVFSSGFPENDGRRAQFAAARLKSVLDRLKETDFTKPASGRGRTGCRRRDIISNFSKSAYLAAVEKVKDHIARGNIYQANLSQKFKTYLDIDDWTLYRRLSRILPVSFSGFFKDGPMSVISASPELFLEFDGRVVSTRPMKGTRPRTTDSLLNRKLKRQLAGSAKERAELLMIVDLERNDLGRVCEYGSIRVDELRKIESYKSVFQAIAKIDGVLHSHKDRLDLIKACFPGGSVTGAPKIRAMEIIDSLEPHPRGVYTGSLGFLSFHNTLEFNILIRSFLKCHDEISFHVGGGIVTDSCPKREYEETLVKAKALIEALTGL